VVGDEEVASAWAVIVGPLCTHELKRVARQKRGRSRERVSRLRAAP
jgi:hypothetical protein